MLLCEVYFWKVRIAGATAHVTGLDIVHAVMLYLIHRRRPHIAKSIEFQFVKSEEGRLPPIFTTREGEMGEMWPEEK